MSDPWWMPVWQEMVRHVDKDDYREIIKHVSKLEKLLQAGAAREKQLRKRLAAQLWAMRSIRKLGDWYARVHQGPEDEVHHALKVEVPFEAAEAIRNDRKARGK